MEIVISSMDSELVDFIDQIGKRESIGTVVNIFDKVINVETSESDTLITIAKNTVIPAPYMLKISNDDAFDYLSSKTAVGDEFLFGTKGRLSLNNNQLNYRSSLKWDCRMVSLETTESDLRDRHLKIDRFLRNEGKAGGILHAYLTKNLSSNDGHSIFQSLYDNYFRQLIHDLSEHFDGENLKRFVGLGIGLTPSGDDFIVGVLAALYSYDSADSYLSTILDQLSNENFTNKTTRVSSHMLKFALDGQFNEGLRDIFNDSKHINRSLDRLKSIGSTSGTDMLAGVSFVLEKLIKEVRRRD